MVLAVVLGTTALPRADVVTGRVLTGPAFKRLRFWKPTNALKHSEDAERFICKGRTLLGNEKFEAALAAFENAKRLCKELDHQQHLQARLVRDFYRLGEDEVSEITFADRMSRKFESLAFSAISEFSRFKGNFNVIGSASNVVIELLGDGKEESPLESTMRKILAEEEPTAEEKAAKMRSEGVKDVRWWSIRALVHRAAVFIGRKEYQSALDDIEAATEAVSARFDDNVEEVVPTNTGGNAEYWKTRASFERDVSSMYKVLSGEERLVSFLSQEERGRSSEEKRAPSHGEMAEQYQEKAEKHEKTAIIYEGLQLNGSARSAGQIPLPASVATRADCEDTK